MNAAEHIIKEIENRLKDNLSHCGFMFHIFSRVKSTESINIKLSKKAELYRQEGKKMQDFLALRITLYFSDDVEIVHQYLKSMPNFLDESVDTAEVDRFCPKRLNLILRVPEKFKQEMNLAISQTEYKDLIDDTYEIQIRTILSEGWHEVEHDLRYKCKEEWEDFNEESRLLNGIYATLESAEWSMLTLFDRLAYSHYKKENWNCMMRNKMRIRFADKSLSEETINYLNENKAVAKSLFRVNRSNVMKLMMEKGFRFPLTYDTMLHLLNHLGVSDKKLALLADKALQDEFKHLF
mgnify:CR=1 FL=1